MNNIIFETLDDYIGNKIYKYRLFQIQEIVIESYDSLGIITLAQENKYRKTEIEFNQCLLFEKYDDAKIWQALEIHKILNDSYKTVSDKDKSFIEYFRMYIDYRDLEFFITAVTNSQLNEKQYWDLMNHIINEYPEKVI